MSIITTTPVNATEANKRETDGRYALQIKTQAAAKRWAKRDEEQAKRRAELEALYGDDACMYA